MRATPLWAWTIVAMIVAIGFAVVWGSRTYLVALLLAYSIALSIIWIVNRRRAVTMWQKRLIIYFILFPIVYLLLPLTDVLALLVGSLMAGLIIIIAEAMRTSQ
jgi:hypothetical protein